MQEIAVPLYSHFQIHPTLNCAASSPMDMSMSWSGPCVVSQLLLQKQKLVVSSLWHVPIINILIELGHPQTTLGNLIEKDNSKCSKAFDNWYHWIKDRPCRANLLHSGPMANRTIVIISQNSIHKPLIYWSAHFTFTRSAMYFTFKGVLVCL